MPANKPKFKISYNCPVVLTYAAVCLVLVAVNALTGDRKSTRLNSSHTQKSRMPSSA